MVKIINQKKSEKLWILCRKENKFKIQRENKRTECCSFVPEWNDAGAGDCVPNA